MIYTQYELMQTHINALFTTDSLSNLIFVNEPWDQTQAAPKAFIGYSLDSRSILKFHHAVHDDIRNKIINLNKTKPLFGGGVIRPEYLCIYADILQSRRHSIELCFYVQDLSPEINNCIIIDEKNVHDLALGEFDWLKEEVEYSQPCMGFLASERLVSICRSVRKTPAAHEAGIETAAAFRGMNYAKAVLAAWADAVRGQGIIPMYSTSLENASSQRVAEKSSLYKYGISFSFI